MTSTRIPFVPIGTKLNPPSTARRRVARPSLVDRLVAGEPRRVTLVDAPAGWGKTSLLAEWFADARERRPFAWLTLDRGDNDPVRFWGYTIEALRTVAPTIGSAALDALGVSGTDPVEVVLPPLINELASLERGLVLVLEDYHAVESPDVHRGVSFLVEHLPANLELVIATRLDPPLPLPRLRARGEMLELRTADLRFEKDEAEELLRSALGDGLRADDVERLVLRTEGWAAGLYLAALSLAGRDDPAAFIEAFAGDDRHVVDYLGGEVLDGLAPETRTFLLRTSILERLSAPLCDHVLDSSSSAQTLLEIERANLFLVPLDDRREWYRYHHLFRDLLRHELDRSDPAAVAGLHHRAAEWSSVNELVDEAIVHLLAAGDPEAAAATVERSWRLTFNRGELATVDRWLDDLPESLVAGSADLCVARAWVSMDRGRPRDAARWVAGTGDTAEGAVLDAVLAFKLGDLGRAERVATEALTRPLADSPLGLPAAHCILGIALYYRGAFAAAAASLAEAARSATVAENRLAEIYALGYLGLVQLDSGDRSGAAHSARDARALASGPPASEHFVTAMAHLAYGLLHDDLGALEQAVALARRGAAPIEVAAALRGLGGARRDPATLAAAREAIADCPDTGRLLDLIGQTELGLRGRTPGPRRKIAGDLSDRELAVLRLLPGDDSLREIAATLYLSLNTLKTHSRSIYRKLDASSREEAVARGRELGLLEQDPQRQ